MRTSLAAPLAIALAFACTDQPTAPTLLDQAAPAPNLNGATSFQDVFVFDFDIPDFGPLDCLGETVHWVGTATFLDHIVIRPDGTVHINSRGDVNPESTMTGASSGTWVNPRVVNHFVEEANVLHINERIRWTNQATGQRMDVWTRFFLANGQVQIDTNGPTCTLRN